MSELVFRALSVNQPFAEAIASGEKIVENRSRPTNYRGPLAIHASKGSRYLAGAELNQYTRGAIVAIVRVTACRSLESLRSIESGSRFDPGSKYTAGQIVASQHAQGPYCWILEDVARLDLPIECRGSQGIFFVSADRFDRAILSRYAATTRDAGKAPRVRHVSKRINPRRGFLKG